MKISRKEIQTFFLRNGYLLICAAWLITLSFLVNNYWWYISSPSNVQQLLEKKIQERETRFGQLLDDKELMQQLLNRNFNEETLKEFTGKNEDFYLYFFKGPWETFWTTNQIALDSNVLQLEEGIHFQELKSGFYEIIRRNLGPQAHVFCFIPVKEQYYFSNPYLPDRFYQLPRISNQYKINKEDIGLPIKSISGQTLFSIQHLSGSEGHHPPWPSGILLLLAIVCVLIFFNQFALFIGKNTDPWWGLGFLCAIFVLLRVLNYLGLFSFDFRSYELFASTIYASNLVLRSLGDLLINVILVGWLILYAYNQLREKFRIPEKVSAWKRYLWMFILSVATFYLVRFVASLIRGLVINSKISFDVTDFFSLNIYSFIGFVILGLLGFCFFFLSPIINRILTQLSQGRFLLKYIVLGISGFIWLSLQLLNQSEPYTLWVMIWVIFYIYLLDLTGQRMDRIINLEQFILWLIVLTLSVTAIMVYYNKQRELGYRKQLTIKLTKQQDPTLILNLGMMDTVITKDPQVVSFFQAGDSRQTGDLRDYLLNNYFPNLQNKYDFTFYTFNSRGAPIDPDIRDSIGEVIEHLTVNVMPTGFMNLFFQQVNLSDYHYIATLPIPSPQADSLIGFLYYRLSPKTIKPESLYPELLMQTEDYRFKSAVNKYSYAVYDHLQLAYHRNGYPFPLRINARDVPDIDFNYTNEEGHSLLRYRVSDSKVIVMVKENRSWMETMTLFAYLFGIFLLLVLLFNVFRILVRSRLRFRAIRDLTRLNIRNRVHAIIIFIVIFVFIVLGASTIKFFINRYDTQHKNELDREVNSLLTRVERIFQELPTDNGDLVHFYNLDYGPLLKNHIQRVADMDGVDINIYDLDGNLRISTQSLIYKNGLLSWKMDPSAYFKLYFLHQVQVIQKEQVGNLSFLSSYVPVRNSNGDLLAFLNQPYYASQSDLKLEISNFLVTLINLNAFIFLLAGLLALLFTHSITRSFTLIIEKLRNVNLTGKNEEIDWEYDDEIGKLVDEYNKMVHKLEESAAKLAKSEREGAWREMARQVAHEIKNPLTPMKLSLQHLQQAIRNESPRKDQLTHTVAQTIIEQIEHLAQIASDFSAFANISYAHKEKVVLNEILASVISLHHGYDRIDLDYIVPEETYYIIADKTQINRVFTNLIQNAMQAVPEGQTGQIRVWTRKEGEVVVISIRDNGSGIEEGLKEKIFTPNFTTKSSGTGLGLAICKNILLQSGGDIWFETAFGRGTTFHVQLPLVHPAEPSGGQSSARSGL